MGRAVQILRGAQAGDGPERFRQPGGYTSHSSWRAPSSASSLWDQHVEDLLNAAYADRSSFGNTWVPAHRPAMATYIASALVHAEDGNQVPFATRSTALDRVVGSVRLYELERWDWSTVGTGAELSPHDDQFDRVSIGHTWLASTAQRSPVNTEAKLLMLDHAFTRWGVGAVRLQTDARNHRSRAAIARIGCTLDGVLRSDRPTVDGTVRDSAIFSITADE
jgi:RimJ/RimL family protein N-acetyltransferase